VGLAVLVALFYFFLGLADVAKEEEQSKAGV
jgi:hypothetical protein